MSTEQPQPPAVEDRSQQDEDLPLVIRLARLIESGEKSPGQTLPLTPEQLEAIRKERSEFLGRVFTKRLNR